MTTDYRFIITQDIETNLRMSAAPPKLLVYDFVLRVLDMVVSLVGLAVLSPLVLLVAIATKLDTPGPVFFRQQRLGWKGVSFRIFKFRSMVVNAEHSGAKLRLRKDDPRVTKLGKWLRRFHFDEIPQLINVLRGEMSLVGPRPALPFHLDYYEEWEKVRLWVRPGITGLAQVWGGNRLTWDERIIIDVYYVRNRGVFIFLRILVATVRTCFQREGITNSEGGVKGWTRPVPPCYKEQ